MDYVRFTKEMKKDYTILAPNMLPCHFKMYIQIMKNYGYNVELLETKGRNVVEAGLKYVHNDTCYPAIVVIGQFLDAIQSGKYDTRKIALIMFQTGGGCRASNYIYLIRKALARAGYSYIPVISLSLQNLENHPGFKLTVPILYKMLYATLYGDLILLLENQCKPYEVNKGETETVTRRLTEELTREMNGKFNVAGAKKNYQRILDAYAAVEKTDEKKVRVGIVGEIFVKFSPTGNNGLEKFLVEEGAEAVIPGFLDFLLYSIFNNIVDYKLYKRNGFIKNRILNFVFGFLTGKQEMLIEAVKKDGRFRPSTPFGHTIELARYYISYGCKMGEGWLLPAEILELADSGVKNVVCTQPFGCLPNHIVGKGMMNPIKQKNPDINIIAVDYDASASEINQQNRIKLMLANASEQLV